MTTEMNDLLAQLDGMLDPEKMKKRAAERNRPMDRSPLVDFTATIKGFSRETIQKPSWSENHLAIELGDIEASRTTSRFTGEEDRITIRMPDEGRDLNEDDELPLMIASIRALTAVPSTDKLIGMRIQFEEDTEEYSYRSQKSGSWQDYTGTRFYYKAIKVVGSANGSKAPVAAVPTAGAIEQAKNLIKQAGEEGIKEAEFNLLCTKDAIIKADKAMPSYLVSGAFVTQNPEVGRTEDGMLVWVGQ